MGNISGKAFSSADLISLLEIINGCREPGELTAEQKETFGICLPRTRPNVGRMVFMSTADGMDDSWCKELWEQDLNNQK
jgi:hypothetical protein